MLTQPIAGARAAPDARARRHRARTTSPSGRRRVPRRARSRCSAASARSRSAGRTRTSSRATTRASGRKEWPLIPGHEWCGDVVELGEGAEALGWEAGTRVAGTSHAPCGYCRRCIEGRYNICENFGVEGLHAQYGHNAPGAYAEYVVHSVESVFPVPDVLSDEEAAMLDPAAIALHTVVRGGHRPGDTVVVVGPGVMGLLVAECARALGAGRVDRRRPRRRGSPRRRELGHEAVDFTAGDPVAGGARARPAAAAPTSRSSARARREAVGQCVDMVRKGGRVAVIGIPLEDARIPMQRLVLDEIDVVGVRATAGEMPRAIELAAAGRASGCAS